MRKYRIIMHGNRAAKWWKVQVKHALWPFWMDTDCMFCDTQSEAQHVCDLLNTNN